MSEMAQEQQTEALATEQTENVVQSADPTAQAEENKLQEEEKKSFTQAELDRIIQKEKAKAEARAERRALKAYAEKLESMTTKAPQAEAPKENKPRMDQFASVEDYVEAVSDWKLAKAEEAKAAEQHQRAFESLNVKVEKIYSEAGKTGPNFDREVFDEIVTPAVAQAIIDSDIPAKIMTHLTSNPDEFQRIVSLSPARQAAEIGKLEDKLAAVKVKTSNAPDPIKPVGTRSGSGNVKLENASMDDYIALRKQQGARWAR